MHKSEEEESSHKYQGPGLTFSVRPMTWYSPVEHEQLHRAAYHIFCDYDGVGQKIRLHNLSKQKQGHCESPQI